VGRVAVRPGLAREALPQATALVWLDLPVDECIAPSAAAWSGTGTRRERQSDWQRAIMRTGKPNGGSGLVRWPSDAEKSQGIDNERTERGEAGDG
jgi:hypothetical protein